MTDDGIVYRVVAALADAEGVAPANLEYTLADHVDPDALRNLAAMGGGSWEFTFEVPGHEVTVTHAGTVFVDGRRYGADGERAVEAGEAADPRRPGSHRPVRRLVGTIPGMLYRRRIRDEGSIEFVSEGCRALTGYDPNAFVIGGVSYTGDVVHPDDREAVVESIRRSLRDREEFFLVYRIRTASDDERWVCDRGTTVSDVGDPRGTAGYVTEVPESKVDDRLRRPS